MRALYKTISAMSMITIAINVHIIEGDGVR